MWAQCNFERNNKNELIATRDIEAGGEHFKHYYEQLLSIRLLALYEIVIKIKYN